MSKEDKLVDLVLGLVCTVIVVISTVLIYPLNIKIKLWPIFIKGLLALFLFIVTIIYSRRDPRIARISRIVLWGIILTNVFELPIYFTFRLDMPFNDNILASIDRSIGIEIPVILTYLQTHSYIMIVLDYFYDSLILLITVSLILPPMLGQTGKSNELLLGVTLSALATVFILFFIQGVGPWVEYGQIHATAIQQHATQVLHALKSGEPVIFDLKYPEPLVAFPSWHAILAMLSALALARVRVVRWCGAVWAAGIICSCVTTGWHYTSDVIAGLLLSLLAAWVVRLILRRSIEPKIRVETNTIRRRSANFRVF
jgi:membrane-associated phospholipid phosphatase